jgi:hypothetical protein
MNPKHGPNKPIRVHSVNFAQLVCDVFVALYKIGGADADMVVMLVVTLVLMLIRWCRWCWC